MSKTYIHMRRYHAKHYYEKEPEEYQWIGPFRLFLGHNKRDIHEPDWDTLYRFSCCHSGNHANEAKYWFTWASRKFRRRSKQLIRQGRYDELPHKPDNVDWHIC